MSRGCAASARCYLVRVRVRDRVRDRDRVRVRVRGTEGPPRRATRPSYPNPNPILTLTLTLALRPTASRVHAAREAVWYEVGWSGLVPKGAPPMPRTLCPLRSIWSPVPSTSCRLRAAMKAPCLG